MKQPERVELDAAASALVLHWSDASVQRLLYRGLRDACACAACRRARRDGEPPRAAPDLAVIEVHSIGYGLQLIFSDGHDRGIFPWTYLEALAEPAVAAGARSAIRDR